MPRPQRVLDTRLMIAHWRRRRGGSLDEKSKQRARERIEIRQSRAIVTPVRIEFLAGAADSHELTLSRAFLEPFELVENGHVLDQDWRDAERLASRGPPQRRGRRRPSRRRDLGGCLIRAIARMLNYEVDTADEEAEKNKLSLRPPEIPAVRPEFSGPFRQPVTRSREGCRSQRQSSTRGKSGADLGVRAVSRVASGQFAEGGMSGGLSSTYSFPPTYLFATPRAGWAGHAA